MQKYVCLVLSPRLGQRYPGFRINTPRSASYSTSPTTRPQSYSKQHTLPFIILSSSPSMTTVTKSPPSLPLPASLKRRTEVSRNTRKFLSRPPFTPPHPESSAMLRWAVGMGVLSLVFSCLSEQAPTRHSPPEEIRLPLPRRRSTTSQGSSRNSRQSSFISSQLNLVGLDAPYTQYSPDGNVEKASLRGLIEVITSGSAIEREELLPMVLTTFRLFDFGQNLAEALYLL